MLFGTAQELAEYALPVEPWIVEGMVPGQGFTLLVAPPKTGKTMLMLQLCSVLAGGQPTFLGHQVPRSDHVVLFIGQDAPTADYQYQVRLLPHRGFYVWLPECEPILDDQRHLLRLRHYLDRLKPTLCIVDSLDAITSRSNVETKEGAQTALDVLRHNITCPFCLVHHPRKPSQMATGPENVRFAAAGSRYLTGQAASLLALEGDSERGKLEVINRRTAERTVNLTRDQHGLWVYDPKVKKEAPAGRTAPTGAKWEQMLRERWGEP